MAIQTLGGSEDNISGLEYRSSYALIGIAGSGVGSRSAFESSSSEASVLVTDTINFADKGTVKVPAPATLAIFALGIIGLASRRFKK
ncbi:MAG: PEP-CTERM sorting domain-containing protein [Colwellia sp.]|nr:PEP-CTERM sorting domain-containing protein [Colwellia sp.]